MLQWLFKVQPFVTRDGMKAGDVSADGRQYLGMTKLVYPTIIKKMNETQPDPKTHSKDGKAQRLRRWPIN
jgi:hypothetical protein